MNWRFAVLPALFLLLSGSVMMAEEPAGIVAFPGAEGFGSVAVGGRGGRVIKVTNLNSSGRGSFADAAAQKGPRIIVFDVSGVIHGNVKIADSYVTIAGQTAPGGGITLDGRLYSGERGLHDIVIRYLRIRPTDSKGVEGDSLTIANCDKVILDHLSLSWGCDEVVDICGTSNITVQWCSIEGGSLEGHPKGRHNLGLITGYGAYNVSIHHNLFAHNSQRNPFGFASPLDLRNNVIYNHKDGSSLGLRPIELKIESLKTVEGYKKFNVIGNYYKKGPDSSPRPGYPYAFGFYEDCMYYFKDNCVSGVVFDDPIAAARRGVRNVGWGMESKNKNILLKAPVPMPFVATQPSKEAYELVLNKVGCFPRDAVTLGTTSEVKSGTGSWGKHIPPDMMEGLTPAAPPEDSDKDGMSDAWEEKCGLNKNDNSDSLKTMPSGYTAIEEYLNEVAGDLCR